jgi:excisionase family DNA binding protein
MRREEQCPVEPRQARLSTQRGEGVVALRGDGASGVRGTERSSMDVDRHGQIDGKTEDSLVVSVTEAAALLRISRGLAYELARTGELPTVRLGRRMLVPRHALLSWLDTAMTGGTHGRA